MKTAQTIWALIALTAIGLVARQLISFSGASCLISECINEKNALETIGKYPEYRKFMEIYQNSAYSYNGDALGGYAVLKNKNAKLSFYIISHGNIELGSVELQCLGNSSTYNDGIVNLLENGACNK